jgi:NAD(P)-dependent dehydrogenase (short-subunit alcohol dehydrogenase family)
MQTHQCDSLKRPDDNRKIRGQMTSITPAESLTNSLEGKVALVTGAGRGIGRAIAEALASEGMKVGICARTQSQLDETAAAITTAGGICHAIVADLSDPESITAMVDDVRAELGPVHLLVNNAAAIGPGRRLWESDPESWWHTHTVNVRGPFLCSRAVIPEMIENGSGRIINLSSGVASMAVPRLSSYSSSKSSLAQFTRTLAHELAEFSVSAFAYAPGVVETGMTDFARNSDEFDAPIQAVFEGAAKRGFTPMSDTIATFMQIAKGDADALSGCHLDVTDDIEELADRADEIRAERLYVIRRQP